ncbi:tetratricopeptide repeat protein [Ancylostoma caninum]|uniref:Tetratricopeptide repeat protein 38 n=1 Tax=Ancylostoma caninum TaxID=29170 RepID=A0A368FVB3_ANCCA|nr:tetratricopeptide repeat protein [Ancylostoma caninum]
MEAMQAADRSAVLPRAFALGLEGIGTGIGARTNEAFRKALEDLQVDAAKCGNEREKLHAKAVQQFGEGKQSAAAKTWEEILKKHPTDLMAIKFAHDTYFYLGDAKMIRDSVQAVLPKHKGTEPCYSYLHGMLAFGLEECEQYGEAEKEALKALEANRYDCWATHARAHVLEMEGRFDEGIKFLESTVEDWKPGWMLAAHNYWHNGLYYIEKYKNYEVPLTIFDKTASDDYDQAKICREVGVAVYDGISQYILGDYDKCAKNMLPIRDRIYTIGGSNAQRDLFTQTMIHACINSSDREIFSKAPVILDERNSIKKNSPINERLAAEFRRRHPL